MFPSSQARFSRHYKRQSGSAARAGAFAHATVISSVVPEDWQIGEDADRLARTLVQGVFNADPTATRVRVEVTLDVVAEYVQVAVLIGDARISEGRVVPRRPFRGRSVVPSPD